MFVILNIIEVVFSRANHTSFDFQEKENELLEV
jgi:hypothetical protein